MILNNQKEKFVSMCKSPFSTNFLEKGITKDELLKNFDSIFTNSVKRKLDSLDLTKMRLTVRENLNTTFFHFNMIDMSYGNIILDFVKENKQWFVSTIQIANIESEPPDFIPLDVEPLIVQACDLEYSESAKNSGITGRIVTKILVGKNGISEKVKIIGAFPNQTKVDENTMINLFQESIEKCVRETKFKSGMVKGQPVRCWMIKPYIIR
jgi:hypothetical protein